MYRICISPLYIAYICVYYITDLRLSSKLCIYTCSTGSVLPPLATIALQPLLSLSYRQVTLYTLVNHGNRVKKSLFYNFF